MNLPFILFFSRAVGSLQEKKVARAPRPRKEEAEASGASGASSDFLVHPSKDEAVEEDEVDEDYIQRENGSGLGKSTLTS